MNSFGFPKRNQSQATGRIGENHIEYFVTKVLGWSFRPVHQEHDYGIDGYIDIIEDHNVTGRGIAIQVKCGASYLGKKVTGGIKYEGVNQHLNYYLNLNCPVILVVLGDTCEDGYWTLFDIEKTTPTKKGWWIEIPITNRLSKETAIEWRNLAGPMQDHSNRIKRIWELSEMICNAGFLAIAIPKDEVESLSLNSLNSILGKLAKNMDVLLAKRSSIEIFFPDYDDDPREIYEIPEVRMWVAETLKLGIPWFYFVNTRFPFPTLRVLYICGCEVTVVSRTNNGHYLTASQDSIKKWFDSNFNNLNIFTDSHQINLGINKEVSLAVGECFRGGMQEMDIESDEQTC